MECIEGYASSSREAPWPGDSESRVGHGDRHGSGRDHPAQRR